VTPLRIALVAGGLLAGGGALFLLYRGVSAMGSGAPASGVSGASGAPRGGPPPPGAGRWGGK
jgi:hypothetical protein